MPDSYGRPLCSSPRLRWEISHAIPIVRKTNETPAKANPTTYQMPVKLLPSERRVWRRRWREDPCPRAQPYPESDRLVPSPFYREKAADDVRGTGAEQASREGRGEGWDERRRAWRCVRRVGGSSGSGARRARVQVRVPLPVRSCPTVAKTAPRRPWAAIGITPYSGAVWCGLVRSKA